MGLALALIVLFDPHWSPFFTCRGSSKFGFELFFCKWDLYSNWDFLFPLLENFLGTIKWSLIRVGLFDVRSNVC